MSRTFVAGRGRVNLLRTYFTTQFIYLGIMSVFIHSLALFSINNSINGTNKFGILLGFKEGENFRVQSTFELLSDGNKIDRTFYNQRLQQHITVDPKLEKIGIYHITASSSLGQSTIDKSKELNSALVLTINTNLFADKDFINAYYNSQPISTILDSNDVENTSLSTVVKNQEYSSSEQTNGISVDLNESSVMLTNAIGQLSYKLQLAIDYCQQDRSKMDKLKVIQINNMIGQLAKSVSYLTESTDSKIPDDQLLSSELSLLTAKLVSVEKLKAQINNNIASVCIKSNTTKNLMK